jgi:hypothetical protein
MAGLALEAELAADAADTALNIAEPIAEKFGDVLAKFKKTIYSIYDPYKREEDINNLKNIAQNQIVNDAENQMANVTTLDEKKNIINAVEKKLENLNKQVGGQRGGKKILSRTNKSITQFLNSKVTFQSILKRMTSKHKNKRGVKRRTRRIL